MTASPTATVARRISFAGRPAAGLEGTADVAALVTLRALGRVAKGVPDDLAVAVGGGGAHQHE